MIEISAFNSVSSVDPVRCDFEDFGAFYNFLVDCARSNTVGAKEDNFLLSPGVYQDGMTRGAANVAHADLLFLDSDDASLSVAPTRDWLTAYNFRHFIYTSYSHTEDHPKFRIVLPLSRRVDGPTYEKVWQAFYEATNFPFDRAPSSPASLFYAPCNEACGLSGGTYPIDVDDYIAWHVKQATSAAAPTKLQQIKAAFSAIKVAPRPVEHINLFVSDLIRSEWVTEYLSVQQGDHHRSFYGFLCKVALRAKAYGYALTESELASIASELDHHDIGGPYYNARKYRGEAQDALRFAAARATDPTDDLRRSMEFKRRGAK